MITCIFLCIHILSQVYIFISLHVALRTTGSSVHLTSCPLASFRSYQSCTPPYMRSPVVNNVPNRCIDAGHSIKRPTRQQGMMACSFFPRQKLNTSKYSPQWNEQWVCPQTWKLEDHVVFFRWTSFGGSFDFHSGPGCLISGRLWFDLSHGLGAELLLKKCEDIASE